MSTQNDKLENLLSDKAFDSLRSHTTLTDTSLVYLFPYHGEKVEAVITCNQNFSLYLLSIDGTPAEGFRSKTRLCDRIENISLSFKKRIDNILLADNIIQTVKDRIYEATEHDVVVRKTKTTAFKSGMSLEVAFGADTFKIFLGEDKGVYTAYLRVEDFFGEESKAKIKILTEAMSKLEIIERM